MWSNYINNPCDLIELTDWDQEKSKIDIKKKKIDKLIYFFLLLN